MSHLRKSPEGFYAYPEHVRGLRGIWKRLLWRLGFDPLTVRQRLHQVRREVDDWKRWGDEFADAVFVLWGDHRDEIRSEIERQRREGAAVRSTAMSVVFVDCETTGLDPDVHEIWEVGLIVDSDAPDGGEYHWFLPVNLGRADSVALRIGGFHARYQLPFGQHDSILASFAAEFAALTRGCHLAGAVVSFDEERLRKLLRANGACPEWHYHIIEVEALAVGWISHVLYQPAEAGPRDFPWQPPWDSDDLSRAVGVDPDQFDRHTALGDARWAKALYDSVTG